jgi:hypothetical protein
MTPYEQQRTQELAPLADAISVMVRGVQDVRIEQTGGQVYCVEGTLGTWRLDGDEDGWSLTDQDGLSVAWGAWFEDERRLSVDPDTGALDPDECAAAALAFAAAHADLIRSAQH